MKTIEKLKERAAKIGATVDDSSAYSVHIDAPSGYVWCANSSPSFAIHYATNSQSWLVKALREEEVNLRMGVKKVTDVADIEDHRYNLGDDNWGAPESAPARLEF